MKIFISYSNRDSEIAQYISDSLKMADHEIWKWDESLKPGDNIAEKIQEGIEEAAAFVLLVSANSLSSKSVQYEFSTLALHEAGKRNLKIIPLIIDDSIVPSYLNKYLWIYAADNLKYGIKILLDSLKNSKEISSKKKKDTITFDVKKIFQENEKTSKNKHISQLNEALHGGKLTLVCGAGVSVAASIPVWDDLLLSLLNLAIPLISKNPTLAINNQAAFDLKSQYSGSSLILGKHLKNTLGNDFNSNVRDVLYAKNPNNSDLLDAIVELARPRRDSKMLDSIITFNYDDLIERNLSKIHIDNITIHTSSVKFDQKQLPIYHVHGFLPRVGSLDKYADIVLSEDAYHSQFIDPFNWPNLIQLNKYSQNTCLFVGISLTDPNLRRLLDISWRKSADQSLNHYVIKKLPAFKNDKQNLKEIAMILEEKDANLLGLNVIWVNEYDEIPLILKDISNNKLN